MMIWKVIYCFLDQNARVVENTSVNWIFGPGDTKAVSKYLFCIVLYIVLNISNYLASAFTTLYKKKLVFHISAGVLKLCFDCYFSICLQYLCLRVPIQIQFKKILFLILFFFFFWFSLVVIYIVFQKSALVDLAVITVAQLP